MSKSRNHIVSDDLYSEPLAEIADFAFDEKVAAVFPDMIKRSAPGYATTIAQIGVLAGKYTQPDSYCYDLGCSLGAATLSMRHKIDQPNCRIIAIDNSVPMLKRCRQHLTFDSGKVDVSLICADIRNIPIQKASLVVMNFTLQFIPPDHRFDMLQNIYDGLLPGGVLLLSEKVRFSDPQRDHLLTELHHDFKKVNGYSALEISQKRSALEKVMLPDTVSQHHERLAAVGFRRSEVWFQCFNFASILAFR